MSKSFYSSANLKKHNKEVHEGNKIHKCQICEKHFSRAAHQKLHFQRVHAGGQQISGCDFCNKSFAEASQLKEHIYTVHEGHKDFECDICNQRFTTAQSVKRHRISRHGVKIQ